MKRYEKIKIIISAFLIALWMVFVFAFSAQDGEKSSHTSKGTVEKVVTDVAVKLKLSENKKQEIIDWANPFIRKIAHYIEYALGGVLIINFLLLLKTKENRAIFYSIIFRSILCNNR